MGDDETRRKPPPPLPVRPGGTRPMPGAPPIPGGAPMMREPTTPIGPESTSGVRPVPTPEGFMSTAAKMTLADIALALRDEQLDAKVVHYRADLQTNPDLDAVTAQVINELQNLQAAARAAGPASRPVATVDRAQVEIELIASLQEMLSRIFRPGKLATVIERKLGEVAKRFARLFFESELADKIRGSADEIKTMRFAEQAMYHALYRSQPQILKLLEGFQYSDPTVKERASHAYFTMLKGLRNDFLARTTPELNVLVKYLNEVLRKFFAEELPPKLGELSWEVVKETRLADSGAVSGYKISAASFPRFRTAFERRFLQLLVPFTEDEMLRRVRETESQFRSETIRLVADPAIFSDVCGVISDAVYDMLYNDGFLDLPSDWRARLAAGE